MSGTIAGDQRPAIQDVTRRQGMQKVSAAIIGGGKISEHHLRSLCSMKETDIAGVCDLSPALARFTAERFAVPNWYTDHREMLGHCDADVVHVLTPPATHDRIVRDCLDSGRHVVVEKPVALSNQAFRELWDYASSRDLRLMENHNYRFNTPFQQIEKAIVEGRIGSVEEIEIRLALNIRGGGRYADENLSHSSHQLPAGIIHEFITHLAYMLLRFLPEWNGDSVDSIHAAWRNHGNGELFKYDELDATIISGATHGRIRFSCRQWPDCLEVKVRGSDGTATAELFNPFVQVTTRRGVGQHLTPLVNAFSDARARAGCGISGIWQKIRNRTAYEGLERFLQLTYVALRTGRELPVGFDDMDRTSQLIDLLLASENRV
jgi:predicted dehydrogenase